MFAVRMYSRTTCLYVVHTYKVDPTYKKVGSSHTSVCCIGNLLQQINFQQKEISSSLSQKFCSCQSLLVISGFDCMCKLYLHAYTDTYSCMHTQIHTVACIHRYVQSVETASKVEAVINFNEAPTTRLHNSNCHAPLNNSHPKI